MPKVVAITWDRYLSDIYKLVKIVKKEKQEYDLIIGVSRGGLIPATIMSHELNIPLEVIAAKRQKITEKEYKVYIKKFTAMYCRQRILIVDDIYDTGATMHAIVRDLGRASCKNNLRFVFVYSKKKLDGSFYVKWYNYKTWIKFPYETEMED